MWKWVSISIMFFCEVILNEIQFNVGHAGNVNGARDGTVYAIKNTLVAFVLMSAAFLVTKYGRALQNVLASSDGGTVTKEQLKIIK